MFKNITKLYLGGIFLHKGDKKWKENQEWYALYIRWYDVTYTACKTLYFITSWNLIKSPQSFVQRSFSIQLTKIWHKNRDEVLASIPS